MSNNNTKRTVKLLAAVASILVGAGGYSAAGQTTDETEVTISVLPFAELSFDAGNLLYLFIPPPGSTAPSEGVNFTVDGNANATLVAEPDNFILVNTQQPGPQPQYLGAAVLNGNSVGYKLVLWFPGTGYTGGSPTFPQIAGLPGNVEGPTVPPLTVDLSSTGQQRSGVIHMETNPNWTPDGGIPLPGVYVGEVTLTLTASN